MKLRLPQMLEWLGNHGVTVEIENLLNALRQGFPDKETKHDADVISTGLHLKTNFLLEISKLHKI